ncbi:ENDOU [Branchiostoma lanceolatum]|uniref:Uridylate-specific endoribonuclease n=1 Tax=Branchiostoma lanceolatum TaxID=7740 RepID=A0A8K0ERZ4_BRALA|nr:ENDOU [Branchiostoma lanceolatum]
MEKLTNIPTYSAFMQLLDNYESDIHVRERETIGKISMSLAFLDRCLETDVMRESYSFLLRKGKTHHPM